MTNPNPPNQFKPGKSGNPGGRPKKGYSITEWFKEMLSSNPEVKDAIGKSIVAKAMEGDSAAMKLVWNYMDGMPVQKNQQEGDLNLNIKWQDGNNNTVQPDASPEGNPREQE